MCKSRLAHPLICIRVRMKGRRPLAPLFCPRPRVLLKTCSTSCEDPLLCRKRWRPNAWFASCWPYGSRQGSDWQTGQTKWIDRGHVASESADQQELENDRKQKEEIIENMLNWALIECAATWTAQLINVANIVYSQTDHGDLLGLTCHIHCSLGRSSSLTNSGLYDLLGFNVRLTMNVFLIDMN